MRISQVLKHSLISGAATLLLYSCMPTDEDKKDTNTQISTLSSPSITQEGTIISANASSDYNYAWKINDVHVGSEETLDLSNLDIYPIETVTLYYSNGKEFQSIDFDTEFNNKPNSSYQYDYINKQLIATSTDPDGDTLTHQWFINGELLSSNNQIDVSDLPLDFDMFISLVSSDGILQDTHNQYGSFYYDFNIQHRVNGNWITSSATIDGIGNPVYKIENNEPSAFTISPSILNLEENEYANISLALHDDEGNIIDSSNYSNRIYEQLEVGEYYLTVGTDEANFTGEFEIDFTITPDSYLADPDFNISLFKTSQLDPSAQNTIPYFYINTYNSIATVEFYEPVDSTLSYVWIINDEVVGDQASLNLSELNYEGPQEIILELTFNEEITKFQLQSYNFGYKEIVNNIEIIDDRFINSGVRHPLSSGNDIYQLTVLEPATFFIKGADNYSTICIYEESEYDADIDYSCNFELKTTLPIGTYNFIIGSYQNYASWRYRLEVLSDVKNSASLTLLEKGIDEGVILGNGLAITTDYLSNAKVCLDKNRNSICEENEDFVFTDESGEFLMITQTLSTSGNVIIESNHSNYVLKNNQNYEKNLYSPLTTLIFNYTTYIYEFTDAGNTYNPLNDIKEKIGLQYLNTQTDYLLESNNTSSSVYFEYQLIKFISQVIFNDSIEYHEYFANTNSNADITTFESYLAQAMVENLSVVSSKISEILLNDQENLQGINDISFNINIDKLISKIENFHNNNLQKPLISSYGDYGNYFDLYNFDISLINGIEFNYDSNDWGGHHNLMTENLELGQGKSDLMLVDTGMINSYIHTISENGEETFIDLTSDFAPYKNNFPEYAVKQGQDYLGRQKAIPLDLGPGVAFYRRDYMEDLGYDLNNVMQSWESFIQYGEDLKANHDMYLVSNADSIARAMIYGNTPENTGVYIHNNQILIESEKFKEAFEIAKEIHDKGLEANTGMWNDNWYNGFRYGEFAMEIQGAWMLGHMQGWIAPKTSGLWGMSHLPNGLYASWGGTFLAIPKYSEDNKNEAWSIIEYMIDENKQLEAYKEWAMFPANTKTYSDDYLDEPIEFLNEQPARKIIAEVAQNIVPTKAGQFDTIAETLVFNEALQYVLDGEKTIDEALSDAADELNIEISQ